MNLFRASLFSVWLQVASIAICSAQSSDTPKITLEKSDSAITVKVDGELFTAYHFAGFKKPIFYPLKINEKVGLTRSYPMQKVEGEQPDHPHHKSVWFSHQINNIMFWAEKGIVKHRKFVDIDKTGAFKATHDWIHDDKRMLKDETTVSFLAGKGWRAIDYEIKLIASDGDVLINDTKEGTFAIRVHPALRNKAHKPSGIKGGAMMVNSEGEQGPGIWGKPAAWVDYNGKIDESVYGVAIFDHPKNLRHPSTWHARDYGLLAANPFGAHYFQNKEKGAGEYTIPAGQSLTLRYRLVIHEGDHQEAGIGKMYEIYASQKPQKK